MPTRVELNLRLPNSPGALAGVCQLLDRERVTIDALSLDVSGRLRLIVDNHVRGLGALRAGHHTVIERDVVVLKVPAGPGGLAPAAQLFAAAGVNVEYAYSGAAMVVLGVDDALRASTVAGA
jgi:hypothetical protein